MKSQRTLSEFDSSSDQIDESDPKRYQNRDWLYREYVENRRAMTDIADELGCGSSTIRYWIQKFDIETRSPNETKTTEQTRKLRDESWVREQYIENRRTASDIGNQLNVSENAVLQWLQRHNIPRRSNSASQHSASVVKKLKDKVWLREQYVQNRQSTTEIADELDVSSTTIINWLRTHDITIRDSVLSETALSRLRDSEWMYRRYVEEWAPTTEIASQLGCSPATVSNWLSEHEIAVRPQKESILPEEAVGKLQDADWLREQYIDHRKTLGEIGEELGVSGRAVGLRLEAHGIERRESKESRLNPEAIRYLRDADWLREQYIENERGTVDIAEEIGAADSTVRDWLRSHNIEIRSISEIQSEGDVERLHNKIWLREQYVGQGKSPTEIADAIGVTYGTVRDWLRRHNIEIRPRTEGDTEKLRDEEWLREQYVENQRSTYDIADELGLSQKTIPYWLDKYGIETRSYVKYVDRIGHVVRSSWELAVANLLVENGIEYGYESEEFDWGDGHVYTPDFVTDEYVIEVKGYIYTSEREKARAAMDALTDREYVVIGTKLPSDVHIPWEEHKSVVELIKGNSGNLTGQRSSTR